LFRRIHVRGLESGYSYLLNFCISQKANKSLSG
jgi:hypothetical protein